MFDVLLCGIESSLRDLFKNIIIYTHGSIFPKMGGQEVHLSKDADPKNEFEFEFLSLSFKMSLSLSLALAKK